MKISGCIIARDKQDNITQCINSLKPYVNEIILVDTGSKDNTVKIAENLGAQVLIHQWNNDFSEIRNYALNNVSRDWIIFLDYTRATNAADIIIQISPTNSTSDAIDHITETNFAAEAKDVFVPTKFLRYIRLGYKSSSAGNSTTLDVYFQARA